MEHALADLADTNYVVFCSCLQFVLLILATAVSTFSRASLPGVLALCQLQAYALLYVGLAVYAVVVQPADPAAPGNADEAGNGGDSSAPAEPGKRKGKLPFLASEWDEQQHQQQSGPAGAAALAAVVAEPAEAEHDAAAAPPPTPPALWEYAADLGACARSGGAHVRALYLAFSLVVLVVCLAGAIECGAPPEVGREWEDMGAVQPAGDSRVHSDALAAALRVSLSVSAEQLAALGVGGLARDSYVRDGDGQFFRVVRPNTRLCDMTWESRVGLWVGVAFSLVQLSVCVTAGTLCVRGGAAPGAFIFMYYAVYACGAQYAIDRYARMHDGATCARAEHEARELHVFTTVFCGIVPCVVLAVGCLQGPAPEARLLLPALGQGLSRRLVAALAFLFCVVTVGFMYGEHTRRMRVDLVVLSYAVLALLSAWAFVRAMQL